MDGGTTNGEKDPPMVALVVVELQGVEPLLEALRAHLGERQDDNAYATYCESVFEHVGQRVDKHGGAVVEDRGHGMVARFTSPQSAIKAAVEISTRFLTDEIPGPNHQVLMKPGLRLGLAYGPEKALERHGRRVLIGATIGKARILAEAAGSGQVLATAATWTSAGTLVGYRAVPTALAPVLGENVVELLSGPQPEDPMRSPLAQLGRSAVGSMRQLGLRLVDKLRSAGQSGAEAGADVGPAIRLAMKALGEDDLSAVVTIDGKPQIAVGIDADAPLYVLDGQHRAAAIRELIRTLPQWSVQALEESGTVSLLGLRSSQLHWHYVAASEPLFPMQPEAPRLLDFVTHDRGARRDASVGDLLDDKTPIGAAPVLMTVRCDKNLHVLKVCERLVRTGPAADGVRASSAGLSADDRVLFQDELTEGFLPTTVGDVGKCRLQTWKDSASMNAPQRELRCLDGNRAVEVAAVSACAASCDDASSRISSTHSEISASARGGGPRLLDLMIGNLRVSSRQHGSGSPCDFVVSFNSPASRLFLNLN